MSLFVEWIRQLKNNFRHIREDTVHCTEMNCEFSCFKNVYCVVIRWHYNDEKSCVENFIELRKVMWFDSWHLVLEWRLNLPLLQPLVSPWRFCFELGEGNTRRTIIAELVKYYAPVLLHVYTFHWSFCDSYVSDPLLRGEGSLSRKTWVTHLLFILCWGFRRIWYNDAASNQNIQ